MKEREDEPSVLILIPAYNEEAAIGNLVREIHEVLPGKPVLVVNDCSSDGTVDAAEAAGARILSLPHHLGLGGCVQAGYKLAFELGYEYVVRLDGDGQHDPRDVPALLETLFTTGYEMVIGSRFVNDTGQNTSAVRNLGILFFRAMLKPILGQAVCDPTSGFVAVNRKALAVFSLSFPLEYPEIEALVVLQRRRFRFVEVPCRMRPRMGGRSSITLRNSFRYMVHVLLGVFVNILKYEGPRQQDQ